MASMTISHPTKRQSTVFLLYSSQDFEQRTPKNALREGGLAHISETLIRWKERDKLSCIVEITELKKHDYNISPSRTIHTSDAEPYRPIAEIVEERKIIELEAKESGKALGNILKQLGVGA
jgi:type I restriction enzyme M protein